MKICFVCGKRPIVGRSISRRGLAKKEGGVGKKIAGISRRRFFPNLQRVRIVLPNRSHRRVLVCASCIQAGKITKAA
ncbi:MAG: 50S ribosomal protein L28 [Omnitrophica bacterium RIFCSPLOWO2_01_FULL_50_24]|nr:MAG: 50S ribosomal protein L28 [Omnitrophica bacterium RIFCSPLOWO2_01_FULL_50_24]OGW88294.1 MAG: 50S ribosomal protein L28 [Omnitrophica bacterium RIFCSPLOWO2_01_FULL_50_24]